MRIAIYGLVSFYLLCSVAALGLLHAADTRQWGLQPDPLAAVFAWMLALPWSLLLRGMGDPSPRVAMTMLAIGMAINLVAGICWARRCR